MSATDSLGPQWRTTQDREGKRTYVHPSGSHVQKDGRGRTPWTVYYKDHDPSWKKHPGPNYGMTDTLGEAKAWGEMP